MKQSILISFCGPDGVGKSTQVDLLLKNLKSRNIRVKYSWIRVHHSLSYAILRLYNRLGYKRPLLKRKFDATIWILIEIISIIPKLLIDIYLPLYLGYIVICERFLVDSIVSIAVYILRDVRFQKSCFASFLLKLIPRKTISIYLDAEPETIIRRRLNRSLEHDKHIMLSQRNRRIVYIHLMIQRRLYKMLIERINGFIIKTENKRPEEINKEIISIIDNIIKI